MTAVRRWQIGLLAFGLAFLALGAVVLLRDVEPTKYVGIAVWFLGALIIHDGIIAPIVFGIGLIMRRANRRIPFGVLIIVQAALVLGAIVTGIVVPEILKKGIGTANSTLLPLDYSANLVGFYAVLLVLTAAAIGFYLRVVARRQNVRPSIAQD